MLGAAEVLVAREGVAALSVRSVAAAVGTSTRAVYSVFGSKEALLRGLATHALALLMQAVDGVPLTENPLADLQAALLSGFRPFVLTHPDLFRLAMLWSPVTPDAAVFQASGTAFSRLELRVERVRAAGLLPDRNSREVAFELAAVLLRDSFPIRKVSWAGWSGGAWHARTRNSVDGLCCRLSSI